MSDSDSEDVYEVERIVQAVVEKKRNGRITWNYYVKWKGYSSDENTWEPAESFNSRKTLKTFWKNADTDGRDRDDVSEWSVGDEVNLMESQPVASSSRGRRRSSTPPVRFSPRKGRARSSSPQETPGSRRSQRRSSLLESSERHGNRRSRNQTRRHTSTREESGDDSTPELLLSKPKRKPVESERKGKRKADTLTISSDDDPLVAPPQRRRKLNKRTVKSPESPTRKRRSRPSRAYYDSDADDSPPAVRSLDKPRKNRSTKSETDAEPLRSQHRVSKRSATTDSLFTDDENETNPTLARRDNVSVVLPANITGVLNPQMPEIQKQKSTVPAHHAGPRIKLINEAEIEDKIRARIGRPREGLTAAGPSGIATGGASASIRNATGATKPGPGLLTFAKGSLGVKRLGGRLPARLGSKKETNNDLTKTSTADPAIENNEWPGSPMHVDEVDIPEENPTPVPTTTDTIFDDLQDISGNNTVSETQLIQSLFPDSGLIGYDMLDLPSYEEGEIDEAPPSGTTISTEEEGQIVEDSKHRGRSKVDISVALSSRTKGGESDKADNLKESPNREKPLFLPSDEPPSPESSDHQVDAVVSLPSTIWPQSVFFSSGFTSDPSSSSFGPRNSNVLSITDSASSPSKSKPHRTHVDLRLDPYSTVRTVLKDVMPASYDTSLSLNSLLADNMTGPPGKIYPMEVLDAFTTGGSSARLVVSGEATDGERGHFEKLSQRLAEGGVFIVVLGGHSLVLCSSTHRKLCEKLRIPSTLVGLTGIILISHVTISDSSAFAEFAMKAADLHSV